MDGALEFTGVPSGVAAGVALALSFLAFLDEERGVMLELKKALTGVEKSSFGLALDVGVDSVAARRGTGGVVDATEPAMRGVRGVRPDLLFALSVGISGRAVCWPL